MDHKKMDGIIGVFLFASKSLVNYLQVGNQLDNSCEFEDHLHQSTAFETTTTVIIGILRVIGGYDLPATSGFIKLPPIASRVFCTVGTPLASLPLDIYGFDETAVAPSIALVSESPTSNSNLPGS